MKVKTKLLNKELVANFTEAEFQENFIRQVDWLENICRTDFQNYMVDDILVKTDRMSMLNSLEIRSPLLDKRIAELCFSEAHSSVKRKGNVKKYLLKKIAQKPLPKDFMFERKSGFGVPLKQWFNISLSQRLTERMQDAPSGYLNKKEVMHYLRMHKLGYSNHSKKLFSILVWEEWAAKYEMLMKYVFENILMGI